MRSKYNVVIRKEASGAWRVEVWAGDEGAKGYPTKVIVTHRTTIEEATALVAQSITEWEVSR